MHTHDDIVHQVLVRLPSRRLVPAAAADRIIAAPRRTAHFTQHSRDNYTNS